MKPFLSSELDILTRTVYGEARGEGEQSRIAVALVMINRWKSDAGQFARDDTLATACLRHLQFSAWSVNDPNYAEMFQTTVMEPAFRRCMISAIKAFDCDDFTLGSLHYHTVHITPSWSAGSVPTVTIGNHHFYNNIK